MDPMTNPTPTVGTVNTTQNISVAAPAKTR